jgi:hypothetical protein
MEAYIQKLSGNKSLLDPEVYIMNPFEQQKHKSIYTEQWD